MTDDSKLVDAYKSMYEHHQKDADGKVIEHDDKEQLDELAPLAAIPAVMKGVGTAMKVASAVSTAKHAVSGVVNKVRGKGQLNKQAQESVELHDAEGNLTHEITDVVTPEPVSYTHLTLPTKA